MEMKQSGINRSVAGLTAGSTLLLSCFLFSGCNYAIRTKTLFGGEYDQFPAVVLNTQNGSHDYTFDWNKNTIGGLSVSKFKPKAKYWRLHVFNFKDGQRIGGNENKWKDLETDATQTLLNLPFDKLMRADVDLTDNPNSMENPRTLTFIVLLHDEE
jgi:hypothetical protein